jgi:hypothetical protein
MYAICIEFVTQRRKKNKRLASAKSDKPLNSISQYICRIALEFSILEWVQMLSTVKNVNYSPNFGSLKSFIDARKNRRKKKQIKRKARKISIHILRKETGLRDTQLNTQVFFAVSLYSHLPQRQCWYHERFFSSFISLCVSFSRKRIS